MKIARVHLSNIQVPLKHPYVGSRGIKLDYLKTIIRLFTDDGLVGAGETMGSPPVYARACAIAPLMVGADLADHAQLFGPQGPWLSRHQGITEDWMALGGIEMACWDAAGKCAGLPVGTLLGGRRRESISMVCELSAGPFPLAVTGAETDRFFADLDNVPHVVDYAQAQLARYGYMTLKLKSTGVNPTFDLRVLTALRKAVGAGIHLRHDPNGAYTARQAIDLYRPLDELDLQWYEDPTSSLEAMAAVRAEVKTRLATNMWVIRPEHIEPAMRLGSVDVVGIDPFNWGGLANARDSAAACAEAGLGIFGHCFFDLGIATAANLHLCSALPDCSNGLDTCLYLQDADVVRERFVVRDGHLPVPAGPGLGVTLNEEAVSCYSINEFDTAEV